MDIGAYVHYVAWMCHSELDNIPKDLTHGQNWPIILVINKIMLG